MIKKQLLAFIFRWLVSTAAMYVCINLFCGFKEGAEGLRSSFWLYILAGFIFSVVNSIVRPIATIFALPFMMITMGVFTILVNAAMVGLTIWVIPNVTIGFWGSIGSCLTISAINYLVNLVVTDVK
ncbi:MAG: phage holin family protein [Candidatus Saccharibacteria bacterium]|jgi:putative membrane protein|nr:phage holin family protein [Candidatus Saccharibacteria bacterium]